MARFSSSCSASVPLPDGMKELARRIGKEQIPSLHLPICRACASQTSYSGPDLDLSSQDSKYKCPICADPRQYIPVSGQKWTTLPSLVADADKAFTNELDELVPGKVWTFRTVPNFGIGQRAFLIRDEAANGELVMWDCVGYLDDATLQQIDTISGGKGIKHMVISHPHFFTTSSIWSAAFPEMTLWLAEPDFTEWYQRRDIVDPSSQSASAIHKRIRRVHDTKTSLGEGDQFSDFTIYKLGGHFPGSLVLHWKDILFVADTLAVVPSGFYKSEEPQRPGVASVSFLWSFPNYIPLSAAEVKRVCEPLEAIEFQTIFGGFPGGNIWKHGKQKVMESRDIVLRHIEAQ